jgi:hypothetical protein
VAKQNPVTPDFRDVPADAAKQAQAALAGGNQEPLKAPKTAKSNTAKNGVVYTRWAEQITVQQAYRSISRAGLLDVTVVGKVRQSKENSGRTLYGHFYISTAGEVLEKHVGMNERSIGAIITLLQATGFMPGGGALKGTVLNKMFPAKNNPGSSSPLISKNVIANVTQSFGPSKDFKTGQPVLDEGGDAIMERRDQIESFLPAVVKVVKEVEEEVEEEAEEEE